MDRINSTKRNFIPLLFFAAGVILRFTLGCYLKTPVIYWDELKYYGMARSIFQGSGFMVRNTATNFQKILYPLFLSPFFAIDDPAVRVRMITLLNAVLMNSCVFPLWIICNKLGVSKPRKIWLSALLIIWPDMLMTETFMSENLYWPLFFWYITLHFFSPKDKPLLYGLCEGTVIYLGYLCKEIFAAVLPVTAICLLLELKLCPREKGEYRREWKKLVCAGLVFGMLFVLGKLTVFSGMGAGGYSPDITAVLSGSAVMYLIYSVLYLLASTVLSVLVLPVAIPILRFKQLKREHQQFFLYIIVFIVFLILVVAATISINEDIGYMIPRIHLRYFAPAIFLLLPVFAVCPQRPKNVKSETDFAVLFIFAIFIVALFRSSDPTDVDQMTLQWVSGFKEIFSEIFTTESYVFWLIQVIEVSIALAVSIALYMYFTRRNKDYVMPFLTLLIVPVIFSNIIGHISIKEDYSSKTDCWDSVCELSDEFSEIDGNILYLTGNIDQYGGNCAWDCCFEPVEKMYYYIYSYLDYDDENLIFEGGIYKQPGFDPDARVSDFKFSKYIDEGYYSTTDHIDYVVIPAEAKLEPKDDTQFELVSSLSDEYYSVYRSLDPERLDLTNFVLISDD